MPAFYNDNDPHCAGWLRNLVAAGLVSGGTVDARSILDVQPGDLAGFERVHLFAGIGLWDHALAAAGWTGPVWTGSCPCQPLSVAGQQRGHADERHLWPAFYALVAECRPPVVFGEQVASKDGREWFAAVRADLEALGYACGCADLCAAGVGAPHIRQRLYWVAISESERPEPGQSGRDNGGRLFVEGAGSRGDRRDHGAAGRLANAARGRWPKRLRDPGGSDERGSAPEVECRLERGRGRLGDASRAERDDEGRAAPEPSRAPNPWSELEWLACRDGKWRPAQSGIFPLAHRMPGDVAKLRAYGNAIVPAVATAFIRAVMEC